MPRDGSGHGDNATELDPAFQQNITHGAGGEAATSHLDRSNKAAPPPEFERGDALEGVGASGGGSNGAHRGNHGDGKGPLEPHAEIESKKH